jgi:hypothetical protein
MALASRILLLFCLLLLAGCGQDQSTRDNLPPSGPRIIGASAEPVSSDAWHFVRLEWYGNPEPDVAGYRIWRVAEWTDQNQRYVIKDLRVGPSGDLDAGLVRYAWVDEGDTTNGQSLNMLGPDPENGESRGYFWQVQAYDESGNVSEFSPRVYCRLINNPFNFTVGRVSPDAYNATWQYSVNPDVMIGFCELRVYPRWLGPDSLVKQIQDFPYSSQWTTRLDFSEALRPLVRDSGYVCQLNIYSTPGSPNQHADTARASAAVFTTFLYQN